MTSERNTRQIDVKVFPRSGRSEVEGIRNGVIIVRLKSPPDKGKANEELIQVLSIYYGVGKGHVRIVSGRKTPRKRVLIG